MNVTLLVDPRRGTTRAGLDEAMAAAATALRGSGPRLSLIETVDQPEQRVAVWSDLRNTTVVKLCFDATLDCSYLDVTSTSDLAPILKCLADAFALLDANTAIDVAAERYLTEPRWLPRAALLATDDKEIADLFEILHRAVADHGARRHAARAAAMLGGTSGRELVAKAAAGERDPEMKARLERLAAELW